MTKREIMIEQLTLSEKQKFEELTDEELIQRIASLDNCFYCPVWGTNNCANYRTCGQSIDSWYNGNIE